MFPRRRKKATSELKDLQIDRVDGVDKPATGRTFILMKSEDAEWLTDPHDSVREFTGTAPRLGTVTKYASPSLGRGLFRDIIRQF